MADEVTRAPLVKSSYDHTVIPSARTMETIGRMLSNITVDGLDADISDRGIHLINAGQGEAALFGRWALIRYDDTNINIGAGNWTRNGIVCTWTSSETGDLAIPATDGVYYIYVQLNATTDDHDIKPDAGASLTMHASAVDTWPANDSIPEENQIQVLGAITVVDNIVSSAVRYCFSDFDDQQVKPDDSGYDVSATDARQTLAYNPDNTIHEYELQIHNVEKVDQNVYAVPVFITTGIVDNVAPGEMNWAKIDGHDAKTPADYTSLEVRDLADKQGILQIGNFEDTVTHSQHPFTVPYATWIDGAGPPADPASLTWNYPVSVDKPAGDDPIVVGNEGQGMTVESGAGGGGGGSDITLNDIVLTGRSQTVRQGQLIFGNGGNATVTISGMSGSVDDVPSGVVHHDETDAGIGDTHASWPSQSNNNHDRRYAIQGGTGAVVVAVETGLAGSVYFDTIGYGTAQDYNSLGPCIQCGDGSAQDPGLMHPISDVINLNWKTQTITSEESGQDYWKFMTGGTGGGCRIWVAATTKATSAAAAGSASSRGVFAVDGGFSFKDQCVGVNGTYIAELLADASGPSGLQAAGNFLVSANVGAALGHSGPYGAVISDGANSTIFHDGTDFLLGMDSTWGGGSQVWDIAADGDFNAGRDVSLVRALDFLDGYGGAYQWEINYSGSEFNILSADYGNTVFNLNDDGSANVATYYAVDGTQVVTTQQAAIADVTVTGAARDGDARSKINEVIAALETHGLIAT